MDIDKLIKERRSLLGINQQNLADVSGVGLRTIKQIEVGKGNPSIKTLTTILDVLGLELIVQIKNKSE
ncbi:transcriptional regulator [Bacteroidia bacterium]|nr:transcriptional regulator [Bacteroidia bacterium]